MTQPEEECLDGWHLIDKLGAEECFHCTFSTMQDVPGEFQLIWTQAWATVLTREVEAESSLAKERALKWFCFLSQGLLRTPRRGAKAGKGAIAKRFRAVVQGEWGNLVTMWQSDVARAKEREQRREGRRQTHSSCLESLYLLSLYDELSAASGRGVGELRLMTLGNQSFPELPMGGDGKEGCSEPKEG